MPFAPHAPRLFAGGTPLPPHAKEPRMAVPFIDLSRLVREIRNDVLPAWTECLDKTEFVGGPRVAALEGQISSLLEVPHTITCANGTDALIIGLQALGVKHGTRVALPNLTFWATYEAVAQLGGIPVLIDTDPDDLQLSYDQLVSAHEKFGFTHAILPHLYGWTSARIGDIRKFCKERNIRLLEDGAQSFGVKVCGEPLLKGAEIGTISFYPAKVVGGAMDGGAMTTLSKEHDTLIRSLCNHGRSTHYSYSHNGWNSRMGGVQAAFLKEAVGRTEQICTARRKAAEYYRARLQNNDKIRVFGPTEGIIENGYLNVLMVKGRSGQDLADAMKAKGIGTGRVYPETMDSQPPAKGVALVHGDMKHSTHTCANVLNLPLFYGIRDAECDEALNALFSVIG
jgi:UDP-2-acetamido-2-deoxy-ribo-hexuluronate aminotransferase